MRNSCETFYIFSVIICRACAWLTLRQTYRCASNSDSQFFFSYSHQYIAQRICKQFFGLSTQVFSKMSNSIIKKYECLHLAWVESFGIRKQIRCNYLILAFASAYINPPNHHLSRGFGLPFHLNDSMKIQTFDCVSWLAMHSNQFPNGSYKTCDSI